MKHFLALVCICLTVATVYAPPPFGVPEENLAPQCRTPKCPVTQDGAVAKTVNLPYPLDCLLYISCKGEATIESCPSDEVFNKRTGLCDKPEIAKCVPCWQESV